VGGGGAAVGAMVTFLGGGRVDLSPASSLGMASLGDRGGAAGLGVSSSSVSVSCCLGLGRGWSVGLAGTSSCFLGSLGLENCSLGLSAMATFMKSIHMGRAALAPVSFSPRDRRSSKPIQVPQVMEGEKPMNQASV